MNWPRLSVLLLARNDPAALRACLASLAQQTSRDFEVVVLGLDGSEAALDVAREVQPTLPVPLRIETAGGPIPLGEARNRAVALAQASHVAFVGNDVELEAHWVEEALATLTNADMVFSRQLHAPNRWTVGAAARGLRFRFPNEETWDPLPFASNDAAAYRKEVLLDFPCDAQAEAAEDTVVCTRAALAGYRADYNPRMIAVQRGSPKLREELERTRREGYEAGVYTRELGIDLAILTWGLGLLLSLLLLPFKPTGALLFFVGLLWAPTMRRALLGHHDMPVPRFALALAAAPMFELVRLVSYIRGLRYVRPLPPLPAPAVAYVSTTEDASASGPSRPKHATVVVLLAGARSDYVRPETMPFLSGLAKESLTGELESPAGFAARTALFTGRYPDKSGAFLPYVFDPDTSPFRWLRRFGPLPRLLGRRTIAGLARSATGSAYADPAAIPYPLLPFFRAGEDHQAVHDPGALGGDSLFDVCRENGLRYRYLAAPEAPGDDEIHTALAQDLRGGAPHDLYVARFGDLEEAGQRLGPANRVLRARHLSQVDQRLAALHAALVAGYDSWDLLICGDHGMAPVKKRFDLMEALRTTGARPGKDYVVLLTSAMASFWYLTEKGRTAVERLLAKLPDVQVLDEEDRIHHRIPRDRRGGDRLVAAQPGVAFVPDHLTPPDEPVRGAHGYLDRSDEARSLLVLASSRSLVRRRHVGRRPLVDVLPTVCTLLGVAAPEGQEGQSFLKPPKARKTILVARNGTKAGEVEAVLADR